MEQTDVSDYPTKTARKAKKPKLEEVIDVDAMEVIDEDAMEVIDVDAIVV
jgi:hypothetical protein